MSVTDCGDDGLGKLYLECLLHEDAGNQKLCPDEHFSHHLNEERILAPFPEPSGRQRKKKGRFTRDQERIEVTREVSGTATSVQ